MRGGKFISVNNFSAHEHASSKNRHILHFRVITVRDIKPRTCLSKKIYVWIYENGAEKLNPRPEREFFSRQKLSKVDDIKIKSKVSGFFLPLPFYLPFIALLSLLFAPSQGLKKALKFSEIKVQLNSRPERAPCWCPLEVHQHGGSILGF